MGLFDRRGRSDSAAGTSLRPMRPIKVNWDPAGQPAVAVDMAGLEKTQPDMFKKVKATQAAFKKTNPKTGRPLAGLRMGVRVYPDYSQSTEWSGREYYTKGIMQLLAERYLAFGLQVDSNGVIEVIPFDGRLHSEIKVGLTADPSKNVLSYQNVINNHVWRGHNTLGGTKYAPILRDLIRVARTQESEELLMGAVLTDGDPNDPDETRQLVQEASQWGILLKFMGVNDVQYLRDLDDMEETHPGSRLFDNVDTQIFDGRELPTIFDADDDVFAQAAVEEVDASVEAAIRAGVLLRG